MNSSLTVRTPAKINPILEVLGKRPDGYHELALVFQAVGLYDDIHFTPAESGVHLSVDGFALAADDSNLVVKAAKLFLKEILREDRGIQVKLQKRIPLAAGMGGGSSDAAAALRGMDWFFETRCPEAALQSLAERLGSDVPFFLKGGTALGTGRGEKISSLSPDPEMDLVLVKPKDGLSTPAVYQSGKALMTSGDRARGFTPAAAADRAQSLFNGLEPAALSLMPEVGRIKQGLLDAGAFGAMVSGSGPTVFGIAPSPQGALEIAKWMEGNGRMVWVTKTVSTGIERI